MVDHVHHFELEPAGLARVAVPQRDDAALLLGIEQDQRTVAADPAAVADDVVAGIIIAAPAVAVPGGSEPLEELAQPPALGRGHHIGRVDRVEHLAVEHVGHLAHLR